MSDLPKVLLLGDSIRLSYQPHVDRLLSGKAAVVGPADNGGHTIHTLASLPRWIDELGQPDVAHWNNGLHDGGHYPDRDPVQVPIQTYRANLEMILDQLRQTCPVIWATTTPVHPDRLFHLDQRSWRTAELDAYNTVATEVMTRHNVPINDLHALVSRNMEQFLGEDLLHLSEAGQIACAEAVVAAVKWQIKTHQTDA